MNNRNIIRTILTWLPSIMVSMIFIQNGLGKILNPNQAGKVIQNEMFLMFVGVVLLIATILFLYNKTIIWGTTILASYMTLITCIHWYKGKPFEVVALIVACTIFAAYLRQPQLFHSNNQSSS